MKNFHVTSQRIGRSTAMPIKTTVKELLQELTRLTKDAALVLATMKSIFASHEVRLARSLVQVRLEAGGGLSAEVVRYKLRKQNAA